MRISRIAAFALLVAIDAVPLLAYAQLTWTAPTQWASERPSSPMRRAQYRIDGPAGPAECGVFYFGRVDAGDARASASHWTTLFRTPDGAVVDDARISETMVGGLRVTRVEVIGAYVGGISGTPAADKPRPDHELLGAIAHGPEGPLFIRVVGPRATIEAIRSDFDALVRSLAPGP